MCVLNVFNFTNNKLHLLPLNCFCFMSQAPSFSCPRKTIQSLPMSRKRCSFFMCVLNVFYCKIAFVATKLPVSFMYVVGSLDTVVILNCVVSCRDDKIPRQMWINHEKLAHLLRKFDICGCFLRFLAMISWKLAALSLHSANWMGSALSALYFAENPKKLAESGLPGLPFLGSMNICIGASLSATQF